MVGDKPQPDGNAPTLSRYALLKRLLSGYNLKPGREDKMPERSKDWIKQAWRDLDSARAQMEDGFFEWSCFIAQQAAEKAIKAIYQKMGA